MLLLDRTTYRVDKSMKYVTIQLEIFGAELDFTTFDLDLPSLLHFFYLKVRTSFPLPESFWRTEGLTSIELFCILYLIY